MKADALRVFALLLMLIGTTALGAGQNPSPGSAENPTFKVQVDYVEVDAVVADLNGNFIRGLTADDFKIFEDGKPQTITTFSIVDIPIERYEKPLFAARPIDPDVKSNEQVFDGRVYVVIIDDLQTAFERTPRTRLAARKFIEENISASNDLMAVVHTAGVTDANQDFTNNKRLLLAAADESDNRRGRSTRQPPLEPGIVAAYAQVRASGDQVNDPNDSERADNARRSLDARARRRAVACSARAQGRRKTILLLQY